MGTTSFLLGIVFGLCPYLALTDMVNNADLNQVAFLNQYELMHTLIAIVLFLAIGLFSLVIGIALLFIDKIPDRYLLRNSYLNQSN